MIACVRIPRLPVQAERLRSLELEGRPFVVASGASTSGGTVAAASFEAEEAGVQAGMSVREVFAVCKEASVLPFDADRYETLQASVLEALEEWAPAVEDAGLGCAYVDIAGMERLYPDAKRLLKDLARAASQGAPGIVCEVGAAPNKFVAGVAARDEGERFALVAPHEAERFLAPHSVRCLTVSEEMQRRLSMFGLETLGDLARLSPASVEAQFGREGRRAWELSRGIDPSPVTPRRPFRPIVETLAFPAPVAEWPAFWTGVCQVLARLWQRKERKGATVRRLEISAQLAEGVWQKSVTLSEPVGDRDRLEAMLRRRLQDVALAGAVESLTVRITLLGGAHAGQASLFPARSERMKQIKEAVQRIKARYGTTGLYRIAEVEPWSRIPERRYALINFEP